MFWTTLSHGSLSPKPWSNLVLFCFWRTFTAEFWPGFVSTGAGSGAELQVRSTHTGLQGCTSNLYNPKSENVKAFGSQGQSLNLVYSNWHESVGFKSYFIFRFTPISSTFICRFCWKLLQIFEPVMKWL